MMKRVLGTIGLALGVAISILPGYAQSFQEFRSEQTVVAPPRVLDSWMQPTFVRTTQVTDESGETQVRQEPLIQERHERVMIPQTKTETLTLMKKEPEVTVKRTSFAAHVSTGRSSSSSCSSHRRFHRSFSSRPRAISYKTKKVASAMTTSTSSGSSTMVEQRENVQDQSYVMERRHPALDLY